MRKRDGTSGRQYYSFVRASADGRKLKIAQHRGPFIYTRGRGGDWRDLTRK